MFRNDRNWLLRGSFDCTIGYNTCITLKNKTKNYSRVFMSFDVSIYILIIESQGRRWRWGTGPSTMNELCRRRVLLTTIISRWPNPKCFAFKPGVWANRMPDYNYHR